MALSTTTYDDLKNSTINQYLHWLFDEIYNNFNGIIKTTSILNSNPGFRVNTGSGYTCSITYLTKCIIGVHRNAPKIIQLVAKFTYKDGPDYGTISWETIQNNVNLLGFVENRSNSDGTRFQTIGNPTSSLRCDNLVEGNVEVTALFLAKYDF